MLKKSNHTPTGAAIVDAHYRRACQCGMRMDPYRIADLYSITNPVQFQMVKKLLRGSSKGHTLPEILAELRACIDRWEEMAVEDADYQRSLIDRENRKLEEELRFENPTLD